MQCGVTRSTGVHLRLQQRPDGATRDVGLQNGRAALALLRILAGELAAGEIVSLGDFICQPAVHQGAASKPKLFAPGSVFKLVSQYLIQAGGREVIAPE